MMTSSPGWISSNRAAISSAAVQEWVSSALAAAGPLFKPLVATLGERAIARQHVAELGFGNVIKLLAGHVGLVERDFRATQLKPPVCAFNNRIISGTP